jgi:hypothetical protein
MIPREPKKNKKNTAKWEASFQFFSMFVCKTNVRQQKKKKKERKRGLIPTIKIYRLNWFDYKSDYI